MTLSSLQYRSSFQSTPSAWRETCAMDMIFRCHINFNPLPPHGGRRELLQNYNDVQSHFNPLPPHGGRLCASSAFERSKNFNPLPPHGGRPCLLPPQIRCRTFQSTPSAWRETVCPPHMRRCRMISIHSLRMEGDCRLFRLCRGVLGISIHSLRMEGDSLSRFVILVCVISIHSLRMEGDTNDVLTFAPFSYFNPLPPHGGRLICISLDALTTDFNPLPPHGGRLSWNAKSCAIGHFNPLPPHGGRPGAEFSRIPHNAISIHSLRMEGDHGNTTRHRPVITNFNPLPPHGGRLLFR